MSLPLKVGVIGCGNISRTYLNACKFLSPIKIVACADLNPDAAAALAGEFGLTALTPAELLADEQIDIVLNLTIPTAHKDVCLQALAAGKHVYVEKPLGATRADGEEIIAAAARAGRRVGSAPDTFLGHGQQAARAAVDGGVIGKVLSGACYMQCPGHEGWHPSPDFYYAPGGGPLFDMGPYYITTLVNMLGPVARVTGHARTGFATRTIGSGPRAGEVIEVNTPTHLHGVLEFASGALITLTTSFDVKAQTHQPIELYGEAGSMIVPDPNGFGGAVGIAHNWQGWARFDHPERWANGNWRGVGLAEMAKAIVESRPHRASGELAFHVLDVMDAIERSAAQGVSLDITSSCTRPEAFDGDLMTNEKNALIFWGGWDGHTPEASAMAVADLLRGEGYEVRVEQGTACLKDPNLPSFDLVVPMMTMGEVDAQESGALYNAVLGGTGLGGLHGGMGDTFRSDTNFQFMTGGQFVAHPGNIIDYRVEITRPDDPIVKGLEDFEYHSEQYYMHVDPANEVLAETEFDGTHAPWLKGVRMPVAWKRQHGQGRVFYSALGHNAEELTHPTARELLRRGLLWAAGEAA